MTPAERAVIDAARAYEREYGSATDVIADMLPETVPLRVSRALVAAVRALPRPLSEQLAELRVGAVVEAGEKHWLVKANDPELMELWLRSLHETINGQPYNWTAEYNEIEAVVSNPEAARG